ncbi:MAG TPA: NTP transferase domain-containing protein [bacterium]|nr:NTP transferase domain-containing protein [bacterium]HPS30786.1 NTP transferase domain-containing protein [bacterium]
MKIEAVILAAGKGTRMMSNLPKVMHTVAGKPMIGWIIEALDPVCKTLNIVTGHGRDIVEDFISDNYSNTKFSFQSIQDGTGGAVRSAVPNLSGDTTHVIICAGDTPLLKTATFELLQEHFISAGSDLTVVSTILSDPGHYGRIIRNREGLVSKIVEYLDATEEQRKITEINSGIYMIEKNLLVEGIYKIKNSNVKKEYYLTDIIKIAISLNKKVTAFVEKDFISLSGINDIHQLEEADTEMKKRIRN